MNGLGGIWAFLGFKEIIVLGLLALALYGRSGLQKHPYVRLLRPWAETSRRTAAKATAATAARATPKPARSAWEIRIFWFLAIVAGSAVAAWIVTRTLILGSPGPSP
jgi:hypothetical protein